MLVDAPCRSAPAQPEKSTASTDSAQPAASSVAARMAVKRKARRIVFADGSWILLLEAALALGLAVFIVWYTLPAKKKPADKTPAKDVTRKP